PRLLSAAWPGARLSLRRRRRLQRWPRRPAEHPRLLDPEVLRQHRETGWARVRRPPPRARRHLPRRWHAPRANRPRRVREALRPQEPRLIRKSDDRYATCLTPSPSPSALGEGLGVRAILTPSPPQPSAPPESSAG